MTLWIFFAIIITVFLFVLIQGRFEERFAATVLLVNFLATGLLYTLGNPDWLKPQTSIFIVDLLAFAMLSILAFRSKEFWPTLVAALQIAPVLTFFVTWFGEDLKSYGIGLTQEIWAYPQLLILLWAALRARRKRKLKSEILMR